MNLCNIEYKFTPVLFIFEQFKKNTAVFVYYIFKFGKIVIHLTEINFNFEIIENH